MPDEQRSQEEEERRDPSALAERLEQETESLQSRSEDLGREIDQARDDWQRKQADPNVPGAVGEPDERSSDATPEGTSSAAAEGRQGEPEPESDAESDRD